MRKINEIIAVCSMICLLLGVERVSADSKEFCAEIIESNIDKGHERNKKKSESPAKAPKKKFEYQINGRVDVNLFTDSHTAVEVGGGLQWLYPSAPSYNDQGQDINKYNMVRFSASGSRIGVTLKVNDIVKGATGKVRMEADFMGSVTNSSLALFRLRHAYFELDWKTRNFLIGQTSHVTMPDEMAANTVIFGGGYPFNPLARPVQAQFTQRFLGDVKCEITAAAAMFQGSVGRMQAYSLTPDIQLRFMMGDKKKSFWGVTAGFKSLRPRLLTDDETFATARLNTFNAALFGCYTFAKGHNIRAFALWGQDQSTIAMIGGFAPILSDIQSDKLNYGYAAVDAYSVWFDYETKMLGKSKTKIGIFLGYQQNLGINKAVDIEHASASIPNFGIDSFYRIAPRIWYYPGQKLSFALEYSLNGASWGKTFNDHYRPVESYPTVVGHKIQLLARFAF